MAMIFLHCIECQVRLMSQLRDFLHESTQQLRGCHPFSVPSRTYGTFPVFADISNRFVFFSFVGITRNASHVDENFVSNLQCPTPPISHSRPRSIQKSLSTGQLVLCSIIKARAPTLSVHWVTSIASEPPGVVDTTDVTTCPTNHMGANSAVSLM